MAAYSKAILFYNTKAGNAREGKQQQIILDHFKQHRIDLEVVTLPKSPPEIDDLVSAALANNTDLIIAAGGDGTVALISNRLVGTQTPLGIIPLGTGNLLAKQLAIPLKLEPALGLITNQDHKIVQIDTLKYNHRHYLMNISIGVSPKIMETTNSDTKQRFGFFSYLVHFIQQILGLKLEKVLVEYDHNQKTYMAAEVLIANIGTAGIEPLVWSEDVSLTDSTMDLLIFRAANFSDIIGLLYSIFTKKGKRNPGIKFHQVKEYCRIETPTPMPIQADGDVIGQTPAIIYLAPKSLRIISNQTENVNRTNNLKE